MREGKIGKGDGCAKKILAEFVVPLESSSRWKDPVVQLDMWSIFLEER